MKKFWSKVLIFVAAIGLMGGFSYQVFASSGATIKQSQYTALSASAGSNSWQTILADLLGSTKSVSALGQAANQAIFDRNSVLASSMGTPDPSNPKSWADSKISQLGPEYNQDKKFDKKMVPQIINWMKTLPQKNWTISSVAVPGEKGRATFIPASSKKASKLTVIVGQGYRTSSQLQKASALMIFHELGYNVLAVTANGQEKGAGNYINFGYKDKNDWPIWINKVNKYTGKGSKQVLYGQSMGGAVANQAAGLSDLPKSVKAVISDCSFSNLKELFSNFSQTKGSVVSSFINIDEVLNSLDDNLYNSQGFHLSDVSPMDLVKNSKLPELVIATQDDQLIPASESQEIYNNIPSSKKQLWILQGKVGGHASAPFAAYKYITHVKTFLKSVDKTLVPKKATNPY